MDALPDFLPDMSGRLLLLPSQPLDMPSGALPNRLEHLP
jgi:hypothetical protein